MNVKVCDCKRKNVQQIRGLQVNFCDTMLENGTRTCSYVQNVIKNLICTRTCCEYVFILYKYKIHKYCLIRDKKCAYYTTIIY